MTDELLMIGFYAQAQIAAGIWRWEVTNSGTGRYVWEQNGLSFELWLKKDGFGFSGGDELIRVKSIDHLSILIDERIHEQWLAKNKPGKRRQTQE